MGMSQRWRLTLALVGLIVVMLSLAALAYAMWPIETTSEQFRPAPTLFTPPPGG
jgi:type II secretory pathway component PulL